MKTSDNNLTIKPNILVFCRDYLIDDFQENLTPLNNDFNFHYLTDGKKAGVSDTRKRFYERLDIATRPEILTEEVEADIIDRCRYLSNIPNQQARKTLNAMASVLIEEVNKKKPSIILSQLVDEYITHLLSEIAKQKGMIYISFFGSYFPGRAQVTQFSNGSPLNCRTPTEKEVLNTLELISENKFRQDYLQKNSYTIFRHVIAILRYRAKSIAFTLLKIAKSDPLNLHYSCLPYTAERRYLSHFPLNKNFQKDWKSLISKLKKENHKKIIYIPLAYFPESSLNYWIENKKALDYENSTLEIIDHLSGHYNIIVKEHLHMSGIRNPSFYTKINAIKNVINVHPKIISNEVLLESDIVFLGGGSVGVESFIRGKPILTFCNSIYWYPLSNALYLDISDLGNWVEQINNYIHDYKKPNDIQINLFIKQCLCSTLNTRRSGKIWPICDIDQLKNLLNQFPK